MADDRNKQVSASSSTDTDEDLLRVDLASLDEATLHLSPFRLLVVRHDSYKLWSRDHKRF